MYNYAKCLKSLKFKIGLILFGLLIMIPLYNVKAMDPVVVNRSLNQTEKEQTLQKFEIPEDTTYIQGYVTQSDYNIQYENRGHSTARFYIFDDEENELFSAEARTCSSNNYVTYEPFGVTLSQYPTAKYYGYSMSYTSYGAKTAVAKKSTVYADFYEISNELIFEKKYYGKSLSTTGVLSIPSDTLYIKGFVGGQTSKFNLYDTDKNVINTYTGFPHGQATDIEIYLEQYPEAAYYEILPSTESELDLSYISFWGAEIPKAPKISSNLTLIL